MMLEGAKKAGGKENKQVAGQAQGQEVSGSEPFQKPCPTPEYTDTRPQPAGHTACWRVSSCPWESGGWLG